MAVSVNARRQHCQTARRIVGCTQTSAGTNLRQGPRLGSRYPRSGEPGRALPCRGLLFHCMAACPDS